MSKICLQIINFYQKYLSFDRGILAFIAPTGACKYSPSCSEYTKEMIIKNGSIKGLIMGAKRIISCR